MRWPGIRDGNRRQGFFKGKGTGHDATSRHRGAPGCGATGTCAKGENHTGDQPESRPAYRPDAHDPHPGRTPRSHKTRRHARCSTAHRRGTRTGEASIPRRFNRVWRSCRPHEERTQRGRPSKEVFAGGVGPNTPRDTPQRSLRILTGWPTSP